MCCSNKLLLHCNNKNIIFDARSIHKPSAKTAVSTTRTHTYARPATPLCKVPEGVDEIKNRTAHHPTDHAATRQNIDHESHTGKHNKKCACCTRWAFFALHYALHCTRTRFAVVSAAHGLVDGRQSKVVTTRYREEAGASSLKGIDTISSSFSYPASEGRTHEPLSRMQSHAPPHCACEHRHLHILFAPVRVTEGLESRESRSSQGSSSAAAQKQRCTNDSRPPRGTK